MRARSLHLIVSAALMLPLSGAPFGGAFAQAPAPAAPNPQLAAAQAAFETLPEPERRAIQSDLIWSGHFNGAVSGSYGPLTFRAINAFKAGKGAPDGLLTPGERRSLAQAAQAAREAAGFRILNDERTGLRIGIPTTVLPKRDVAPSGSRWQSADGKVTLDTSATPQGESLEAVYGKATAPTPNNPGRKITYKLLRPEFFVVTGETPTGKFYRRLASGPSGLRGFSIGYDKALAGTVDKLVIAIAASFEPFPTGPLTQAPAVASASGSTAGAAIAASAAAVARTTERHASGVAVGERLVATSASATEGCRSLRAGGRVARLRGAPEAGIALLEVEGSAPLSAPGFRADPVAEGDSLVLVAFGEEQGKRAPMALPGQAVVGAAGLAVLAPLQPGQAGAAAFDRQGAFAGLVTGNPSDKVLIAGIAPQRSYALAGAAVVQAAASKVGATAPSPVPAGRADLSTGAIVEKAAPAVLAIVCGL
jgi:hypothetical protein